jgi:hypothetical protein
VISLPLVPALGPPRSVSCVSASGASRLLECPLRFCLDQDPRLRRFQPFVASALIGSAAHAALAALIQARASAPAMAAAARTREIARHAFDEALVDECKRRDEVISERGELPGESIEPPASLPFYAMTRARVARFAGKRFGEEWVWPVPQRKERSVGSSQGTARDRRRDGVMDPELPLQSEDGIVRGIADAVLRGANADVVVEEFKTGEATPERLAAWKYQLLIYAKLYRDQYAVPPSVLRIHSLQSGVAEFPYVERDAAEAVALARKALADLNRRIAGGATPADLARPSELTCKHCPHKAWCEPYWAGGALGPEGADVEGVVLGTDGWEVELRANSGTVMRVDFRTLHTLPPVGARLRISGARQTVGGALSCARSTTVWRMSA